jgi:hypothetical protein
MARGNFWSQKDKTEQECEEIFQAIADLVKEDKIYPIEYASIANQTYRRSVFDPVRLKDELCVGLIHSSNMHP